MVEQCATVLEFDEDVHVALRACLASGHGPDDSHVPCAVSGRYREDLLAFCADRFGGCDALHGGSRIQAGPNQSRQGRGDKARPASLAVVWVAGYDDGEEIDMKTVTAYEEWDPETKLYVGIVPGIKGAHTQAATLDELQGNLKEVLELCLEEQGHAA